MGDERTQKTGVLTGGRKLRKALTAWGGGGKEIRGKISCVGEHGGGDQDGTGEGERTRFKGENEVQGASFEREGGREKLKSPSPKGEVAGRAP